MLQVHCIGMLRDFRGGNSLALPVIKSSWCHDHLNICSSLLDLLFLLPHVENKMWVRPLSTSSLELEGTHCTRKDVFCRPLSFLCSLDDRERRKGLQSKGYRC